MESANGQGVKATSDADAVQAQPALNAEPSNGEDVAENNIEEKKEEQKEENKEGNLEDNAREIDVIPEFGGCGGGGDNQLLYGDQNLNATSKMNSRDQNK